MKIPISMNILILKFYKYIDEYFYIKFDISKINKNILKFIKILFKNIKITLIIKYIH